MYLQKQSEETKSECTLNGKVCKLGMPRKCRAKSSDSQRFHNVDHQTSKQLKDCIGNGTRHQGSIYRPKVSMLNIIPMHSSRGNDVCNTTNEKSDDKRAAAASGRCQRIDSDHLPSILCKNQPRITVRRHEGLPCNGSRHGAEAGSNVRKVSNEPEKKIDGMRQNTRKNVAHRIEKSGKTCASPHKHTHEAFTSDP